VRSTSDRGIGYRVNTWLKVDRRLKEEISVKKYRIKVEGN
jgi:hypothetical protein